MQDATVLEGIRWKYEALGPVLDERSRRQWAAAEAVELGWGGISAVALATGMARDTIRVGIGELVKRKVRPSESPCFRIRCEGGGRKRLTDIDAGLLAALECAGRARDPWRSGIAAALDPQEHAASGRGIDTAESSGRLADRRHAAASAGTACRPTARRAKGLATQIATPSSSTSTPSVQGLPAARATGDLGGYEEEGIGRRFQERRARVAAAREPEEVRVHDFPDKTLGKAIPYGVYDMVNNQGWVSVGIDHDTAQFATNSIRRWWHEMGAKPAFPKPRNC